MPYSFVIAAVLLGVAVLSLALWPLLRRRPAIGGVVAGASLAAVAALYLLVGTPAALDPTHVKRPDTLASAVDRLEAELARNPAQAEGWTLLAGAYRAENRPADTARALTQAVRYSPRDPDLLVQAAEARALAAPGRRFDPDAVAMLKRAIDIQPNHQRSRWFLGVAQRQSGQAAEAAATWQTLLADVDPATSNALRAQIDAARKDAGLPALPDSMIPQPRGLMIALSIDPTLAASLAPDAAVFVLAREPGGPPMPVAAKRIAVSQLPLQVVLSDADSPMPTRRLSQLARVEVLARVSRTGVANAQPGDLESSVRTSASNSRVELVIDRVRP